MSKSAFGLMLLFAIAASIVTIRYVDPFFNPNVTFAAEKSQPARTRIHQPKEPKRPAPKRRKLRRTDLQNGEALTIAEIRELLKHHRNGRILLPHADDLSNICKEYRVNPLLAIGMFQADSQMGVAMQKYHGRPTWNWGNLRQRDDRYSAAGLKGVKTLHTGTNGSFALFRTPEDGITAYCWLIRTNYLNQGYNTVPMIVNRYAPAEDNNKPSHYATVVREYVR